MQSLHSVHFEWHGGRTLELEWSGGRAGISVPPPSFPHLVTCLEEAEPDALGRGGIPAICWRAGEDKLFEPLQLREETDYLVDISLPVSTQQAKERWGLNKAWPLHSRLQPFYRTDPPKRWSSGADGVLHVTGRLNFGSHVGLANLGLPDSPPVILEVACAKFNYFSDFKALLDAISDELAELLLQIDAPTFSRFGYAPTGEIEPLVLLFHVRRLMSEDQLPAAIEAILRSGHSRIERTERRVPVSQLRNPSPELMAARMGQYPVMRGGPLSELFSGFTPESMFEVETTETADTPENRYVKSFLEDMLQHIETLRRRLLGAKKISSAREALEWSSAVSDWLAHPFWQDVGRLTHVPSNSQVLQKREGYRDILRADMLLQLGLSLPWRDAFLPEEGIDGDIRPVSKLYEYWCFFVLRRALANICGQNNYRKGSLVQVSSDKLSFHLRQGAESHLKFNYRRPGQLSADVTLYYNREFKRPEVTSEWDDSYSARFDPDYSILISVHRSGTRPELHWLHFDAKYRLDFGQWKAQLVNRSEEIEESILADGEPRLDTGGDASPAEVPSADDAMRAGGAPQRFKVDDLYKMHTYRDAVLGSRGSYLLFPGTGENESVFIRYPGMHYPGSSFFIPSVGAFQLRPQNSGEQTDVITSFIGRVMEQLTQSGAAYDEETGFFGTHP